MFCVVVYHCYPLYFLSDLLNAADPGLHMMDLWGIQVVLSTIATWPLLSIILLTTDPRPSDKVLVLPSACWTRYSVSAFI